MFDASHSMKHWIAETRELDCQVRGTTFDYFSDSGIAFLHHPLVDLPSCDHSFHMAFPSGTCSILIFSIVLNLIVEPPAPDVGFWLFRWWIPQNASDCEMSS